mmetsp:Transcript_14711/g.31677  ORF Transcript_14711/g.31677 Transcript_14711/m.31677 type:complete len:782 (-) Transcript_14711:480-2825(-)
MDVNIDDQTSSSSPPAGHLKISHPAIDDRGGGDREETAASVNYKSILLAASSTSFGMTSWSATTTTAATSVGSSNIADFANNNTSQTMYSTMTMENEGGKAFAGLSISECAIGISAASSIGGNGNSHYNNNNRSNSNGNSKQHCEMSEEECDRSQSSTLSAGGASWDGKKGRRSSFRSVGGNRFGRSYPPRWRDQETNHHDGHNISTAALDNERIITDEAIMAFKLGMMKRSSSPSHENVVDSAPPVEGHLKDCETASQTSQTDSHHLSLVVNADSVAEMSDDHRSLLGHPSHDEGYGSAMQDMSDSQSAGALSDGEGRAAHRHHHHPFNHSHKWRNPIINSETRFPTASYAASEAAKSDIATVCSGSVIEDIDKDIDMASVASDGPPTSTAVTSSLVDRFINKKSSLGGQKHERGDSRGVEFASHTHTYPFHQNAPSHLMSEEIRGSASPSGSIILNDMGPPLSRTLLLAATAACQPNAEGSPSRAGSVRSFSTNDCDATSDVVAHVDTDDCGGSLSETSQEDSLHKDGNLERLPSNSAIEPQNLADAQANASNSVLNGRVSPGGTIYRGKGVRRYQGRYMKLPLKRFHQGEATETMLSVVEPLQEQDDVHLFHAASDKEHTPPQWDDEWSNSGCRSRNSSFSRSLSPSPSRSRSRSRSRSASPNERDYRNRRFLHRRDEGREYKRRGLLSRERRPSPPVEMESETVSNNESSSAAAVAASTSSNGGANGRRWRSSHSRNECQYDRSDNHFQRRRERSRSPGWYRDEGRKMKGRASRSRS